MGGFYSQMMGQDGPRPVQGSMQQMSNPFAGYGGGGYGGGYGGYGGGGYGGSPYAGSAYGGGPNNGGPNGGQVGEALGGAMFGPVGAAFGGALGRGGTQGYTNELPAWMGGSGPGFSAETFVSNQFDRFANPDKAVEALGGITGLAQKQYDQMQGVNAQMDAAGGQYSQDVDSDIRKYRSDVGKAAGDYTKGQQGLSSEAAVAAGKNANLYNSTDNSMAALQKRADTNAGQAMSLKDAGNVNNQVQTDTRGLYNTEGNTQRKSYNQEGRKQEALYEQKAQGIGRQGLADTGVLSALGAQAMAGQMGGAAPMTGGQLSAMQGANMSRAGSAYARAQQQMQGMRDQGMNRNMDMRTQGMSNQSALRSHGLDQGFAQSDAQYGRGQQAQGMAAGMAQDRQAMGNAYQGVQQGLRGEQNQYGSNIYGANQAVADNYFNTGMLSNQTHYGTAQDAGARQMGSINALYGPQMAAAGQTANIYGQYDTAKMGALAGLVQGVGEIIPF
jgi:hypothetical protein